MVGVDVSPVFVVIITIIKIIILICFGQAGLGQKVSPTTFDGVIIINPSTTKAPCSTNCKPRLPSYGLWVEEGVQPLEYVESGKYEIDLFST